MLSCKELTSLLSDYTDGRLTWSKRLSFKMHLWLCPACRKYVRQFAETREIVAHADDCALSDEAKDVLMRRFKGWTVDSEVSD